jgi:hypothetical protein
MLSIRSEMSLVKLSLLFWVRIFSLLVESQRQPRQFEMDSETIAFGLLMKAATLSPEPGVG